MKVPEYAQACGVPNYTITKRIQSGKVCSVRIDGEFVIDVVCSPPIKSITRWHPKAPSFNWPINIPPRSELTWVTRFVRSKKVRSDAIYRAILSETIPAWGVSGRVLVRKADALAVIAQ